MDLLRITLCFILAISSCYSDSDYRLPATIVPTFYDLSLTIDPESSTYSGTVNISIRTTTDSDEIYIHEDGDSIIIGSAQVNDDTDCTVGTPDEADIAKISCSTTLKQGEEYSLYLEFTGNFSVDDGFGLVKSTYKDGDEEQILIESNFKPIYARRAFPCFDEPDFKASFSVQITHPSSYTAISNSPEAAATYSDDMKTTKFENTPEISTYLLSILVSKLEEVETPSEENLDFKIFTRQKVAALTDAVAKTYYHQIIDKLDAYTGVPYEDIKDVESYLVAVPDYSDATGDFGLFTYRETDLLDEGDKTTSRVKQNIITTMTYKLSHEWYGGDVATKWWSDVWANEAVATYLKYIVSDEVDSKLELTNQFLVEISQKMLQNDAYHFTQPLSSSESEINTEWTIESKLNNVNVEKGASVLHMINVILGGKDNFQKALQSHWNNRKDADTNGTDILKDLLAEKNDDGTNYYSYLENWAFSAGYPLITVSLMDSNDTDSIKLAQKRFLYPTNETVTEADSAWYVPLTSASSTTRLENVQVHVFLKPEEELLFYSTNDQWLVMNSQGGCFYRVNYDETLWRRIFVGLSNNRSAFHVLQRSQMIDDIFNVARTGEVSYSLAMEMTDSLIDETEYYPWYSAFNAFSYLLGKLGDEEVEQNLKDYILTLLESVIVIPNAKFVTDTDTHIDILKKVMVLEWACKLGHEDCVQYAIQTFNSYKESQDSLDDYNARSVIFCNGIRNSENVQDDWDFLWNIYSSSLSVHEQNDILIALGCAEDKEILKSYLQKIITSNSGIMRQDAMVVFNSVFSSSVGLEAAKDFLENNISGIQDFFKDMRFLSEMIYAVAEKLMTDEDLDWLTNLVNNETLDDYEDVRTKANTLTSVNNYWQNNFQDEVVSIFSAKSTESSSTTSTSTSTEPSSTTSTSTESSDTTSTSTVSTTTGSNKSNRIALSQCILPLVVIMTKFIIF